MQSLFNVALGVNTAYASDGSDIQGSSWLQGAISRFFDNSVTYDSKAYQTAQDNVPTSSLEKMATAMSKKEGWQAATDNRPTRNNNPGNLKYAKQPGASGADKDGFAIFDTPQNGFNALKSQLMAAASGTSSVYSPDMMLYNPKYVSKSKTPKETPGFFQVYAPAKDKNNPKTYAEFVAGELGVETTTTIKDLLVAKQDGK